MNKNSINKQTYTKMNKKSLFVLGFSAALLAGCSSDNVGPNGGDGDLSGDAYVSISLHLPTTSGQRAATTDDKYDKGTADEYSVDNATVLYFDGENRFIDAKNLGNPTPDNTNLETGITTDLKFPVQKVSANVKKVLVLLNTRTSNVNVANLKFGTFDEFNQELVGKQASDFFTTTTVNGATKKEFFFMTNSAQTDGTVLASVQTHRTETEAKASPSNVYVERAVAKVSVVGVDNNAADGKGTWSGWTYTIPNNNNNIAQVYQGDQITFDSWALDVTNKKTFPARKFNEDWAKNTYEIDYGGGVERNRFVGNVPYTNFGKNEGNKGYRTFWAEDPNYDVDATYTNTGTSTSPEDQKVTKDYQENSEDFKYRTDLTKDWNDSNHFMSNESGAIVASHDYCLENTFDVTHMKQGVTTRILFKAHYVPKTLTSLGANDNWYMLGNSGTPLTEDDLREAVAKALATTKDMIALTDEAKKAGAKGIAGEFFQNGNHNLTDVEVNKVKAAYGATFTTYEKGMCYYVARIQHFGNDFTPWDGKTDYTKDANSSKKYLGRYGVVRNNWYQMTLNTVSGPGTPDIPEIPNTPDDEQNYYLSTTVRIMDWAVRKQSLDF